MISGKIFITKYFLQSMGKHLLTAMLRKSHHCTITYNTLWLLSKRIMRYIVTYIYISVYITEKQQEKGKEEEEREELVEKWYEVGYSN